jgi:general L-amino acid transport system permease protein
MSSHTFKPDMPPPSKASAVAWMRANLFSSWLNTLLTLLAFYLVYLIVPPLLQWAILDANWVGTTRRLHQGRRLLGVHPAAFRPVHVWLLPGDLRWRVDLTVWLAISAWRRCSSRASRKAVYGLGFLVLYPILPTSCCMAASSA